MNQSYIAWLREHLGHQRVFMVGSVAAIRDEAGRVLVMRRSDNDLWCLPGGSMELGETLAQGIVREVREEVGLDVELVRLVGLYADPELQEYTYPNGDQIQSWSALFECKVVGGSLKAQDGEAREIAYLPPGEMPFTLTIFDQMTADLVANREAAAFDPFTPTTRPVREYFQILRQAIGHAPILLPGTAAFIRDEQGRVLLQHRQDNGLWGLPGGAQALGESNTQTMVREVYEETGLEVEPLRLVGVYSDPSFGRTLNNGDQVQPVVACYEAKITGGDLRTDSPETLDLAYFPQDELPDMIHCCHVKSHDGFADQQAAFFR